jgi:hypothetical protein
MCHDLKIDLSKNRELETFSLPPLKSSLWEILGSILNLFLTYFKNLNNLPKLQTNLRQKN